MDFTKENIYEHIKKIREENKESIEDDEQKFNKVPLHLLKQSEEDLKLALELNDNSILEECEIKLLKAYLAHKRKSFFGYFAQTFCEYELWDQFYKVAPELKPEHWGSPMRINFDEGRTFEEQLNKVNKLLEFVKNGILKTN